MKGKNLPSQGCRTPRDRHDEVTVPGLVTSLSSDGLTGDCSARSPAELDIAKAQALEYGKAGLPLVLMPSHYVGGEIELGLFKGKPRIISIEKVEVVPQCSKPGPKSSKKSKEWIRPNLEQIDLTGTEGDDEADDEMAEGDQPRLTRSSSRSSVQSGKSVQVLSDASETPSTGEKRNQGRPETTGEYRVKKAKAEEKVILDRKRKLEEEVMEIRNPNCPITPKKVAKIRSEVAERVECYRTAPTVDLLSRMTEAADLVMRAAIKSSNIQGVVRGDLQKAHYVLAAGTTVLASRADKEEEGEHGEEVALLRIELQTAKEDVRRMKAKAASDRKRLEDCLKRMERMEEAAVADKGKRRHRPAPLEDEGDEEGRTGDVTMVEVGGRYLLNPLSLMWS